MAKKYQPTELDRVLQQAKQAFPELEEPNHYEMANEFLMRDIEVLKKKIQELEKREETHKHLVPNLQAWRDRHADTIKDLESQLDNYRRFPQLVEDLQSELKELKIKASSKSMAHICMQDDADRYYIELEEYRKLKSSVHKDIEKVWMYDSSYGLDDTQTIDRDACIERVFYKIANEWID